MMHWVVLVINAFWLIMIIRREQNYWKMPAGEFENDLPMLPFGELGKKHRKDFIT